jgi:hypothetical protein
MNRAPFCAWRYMVSFTNPTISKSFFLGRFKIFGTKVLVFAKPGVVFRSANSEGVHRAGILGLIRQLTRSRRTFRTYTTHRTSIHVLYEETPRSGKPLMPNPVHHLTRPILLPSLLGVRTSTQESLQLKSRFMPSAVSVTPKQKFKSIKVPR